MLTQLEVNADRIALIPYGCWPEQLPAGIDAVFTHHTFAGAVSESGKRLGGVRMPMGSVPIFSGDIHVPQKRGKLTYVGAPTLIDFGDSFRPRVLIIADDGVYPVYIDGPTKRLVELTADVNGEFQAIAGASPLNRGDIVKIRVHFHEGIPPLAHLKADIGEWAKALGLVVHSVLPVVERRDTTLPPVPSSRQDSDLVRQYGTARNLDQPTVAAGLAIVEEPR